MARGSSYGLLQAPMIWPFLHRDWRGCLLVYKALVDRTQCRNQGLLHIEQEKESHHPWGHKIVQYMRAVWRHIYWWSFSCWGLRRSPEIQVRVSWCWDLVGTFACVAGLCRGNLCLILWQERLAGSFADHCLTALGQAQMVESLVE